MSFDIGIAGFIFTTAGFVVGVIGILLFFRSIKKPGPSYAVHPFRVRIVDKTQMTVSGLQVSHNGVRLEAQNVTSATLYFWNDGRGPIHQSDILTPYTIRLDGAAQLLECLTINTTREVCGFRILRKDGNRASVNFNIIEPQDGAQVQIIYAGDPNARIRVTGTCVGANEPKRSDSSLLQTEKYKSIGILIGGMAMLAILLSTGTVFNNNTERFLALTHLPYWRTIFVLALLTWFTLFLLLIRFIDRKIPRVLARRKTAIHTLNKKAATPELPD